MRQKGIVGIFVLLILALGIAGGGYYLGKTSTKTSDELKEFIVPVQNWNVYSGSGYLFKYPAGLFASDQVYQNNPFFYRTEEQDGEFVISVGMQKYLLSNYPSINELVKKESVVLEPLEEFQDENGRQWKIGQLVDVAGATNFDAYTVSEGELYKIGIQMSYIGYWQYLNNTTTVPDLRNETLSLLRESFRALGRQIISTVEFTN